MTKIPDKKCKNCGHSLKRHKNYNGTGIICAQALCGCTQPEEIKL